MFVVDTHTRSHLHYYQVFAYGLDLFSTRLTPSKPYDLLPKQFDFVFLVCLLPILVIAAVVFHHLVGRKRLNTAWA